MNTLLSMTISASVVIATILVIRSLFIHRLPKRLFVILWTVAALRMLVPFSFCVNKPSQNTQPQIAIIRELTLSGSDASASEAGGTADHAPPIIEIVWAGGVVISLGIITALHLRSRRELSAALPLNDSEINSRISAQRLRRRITVKVSDRVTSPLTYGVIDPVIILPKALPADSEEMRFVLAHELVHIRRFDALLKMMLTAAACVHWFNPLAWAMLSLANRDIELSCDEAVLKQLGCRREDYAMALIRLEERRSIPVGTAFGRNAVRERIEAIMKYKKNTIAGIIVSACLIAGTTTAFAAVNYDKPVQEADSTAPAVSDTNTDVDVEWWTYDEYKAWLEQEKQDIAELVKQGAAGWTQERGDFIWTQEVADETIALYEQVLEDIKNGVYVSKPINGSGDDIVYYSYSMSTDTDSEQSESDEVYQMIIADEGTVYYTRDTSENAGENADNNFSISDEELFRQYEQYGLAFKDSKLYYNGEPVKYFSDIISVDPNTAESIVYIDADGTAVLTAEREQVSSGIGELTGIKETNSLAITKVELQHNDSNE